ncbi:MAG: acetylornithine transaminase [Deltaproteobacteria bacterium]|nr:acetylornithine transaminase [Deltaproteobacteria bacterium]MBW1928045.1 acetylornithine transaminase [Deltaproteobacteria bacterium]MBW2024965.1 acetylornithine transaminase [Deltaproteobacteria bacterium]
MGEGSISTIEQADTYMFKTYSRFPITLVRGEGCRVWDEDGKPYLDFVGGIAVCALGHSSPVVTKALEAQSRMLVHVSNLFYTKPQVELARLLVENSFADRVFFANSGAEANEAAIKLARKWARDTSGDGKYVVICMDNSFHGRTMATLSATGQAKVRKGFDPLLSGFKFVPFNDVNAIEQAVDDVVCAVMIEPIQGEGGVVVPDSGYLQQVRKLCDERGLLLIFDEVQVGMGRTGKLFAHEHFGVTPDIMTLAKALGNGLPIGAMLATERLSDSFGPGTHASTFGGTPLVTAVSIAVVRSLLEDGVLEHCRQMGDYFKKRLHGLREKYPFIKEVRGTGLILGLELEREGAEVVNSCLEQGFLINCTQERVLRFLPPLIVEQDEIDQLVDCLDGIFQRME